VRFGGYLDVGLGSLISARKLVLKSPLEWFASHQQLSRIEAGLLDTAFAQPLSLGTSQALILQQFRA
jgi:hypothetical protein